MASASLPPACPDEVSEIGLHTVRRDCGSGSRDVSVRLASRRQWNCSYIGGKMLYGSKLALIFLLHVTQCRGIGTTCAARHRATAPRKHAHCHLPARPLPDGGQRDRLRTQPALRATPINRLPVDTDGKITERCRGLAGNADQRVAHRRQLKNGMLAFAPGRHQVGIFRQQFAAEPRTAAATADSAPARRR